MHKAVHMLLWGAAAACVASAATVEEVTERLEAGLQKELEVLTSAQDASTAASAVQPLAQALQELKSLNGLVKENDLWNYIDSTEDVKPRLVKILQNIAKQFTRLEKACFYGCEELHALLAPQLKRDASK